MQPLVVIVLPWALPLGPLFPRLPVPPFPPEVALLPFEPFEPFEPVEPFEPFALLEPVEFEPDPSELDALELEAGSVSTGDPGGTHAGSALPSAAISESRDVDLRMAMNRRRAARPASARGPETAGLPV